jgi:protein-tyrosine phosphatase
MFPSLSLFPYCILVIWQYLCCALMPNVWPWSVMNLLVYYIGKSNFVYVFQVTCFPFDDHNCPPIQLVISFCHSAYSWLKEDIENVVVVHCKAGKARTGLMISSLLLFLKVRLPCIVSVYQPQWYVLQNLHQISYN